MFTFYYTVKPASEYLILLATPEHFERLSINALVSYVGSIYIIYA